MVHHAVERIVADPFEVAFQVDLREARNAEAYHPLAFADSHIRDSLELQREPEILEADPDWVGT